MEAALLDKRERILAAAAELIVKNGLQCSMSEIAQTAGVAIGSLYNYFESKDDLVQGVYRQLTERIAEAMIVGHSPEVPHEVRIRGYIENYIDLIWSNPDLAILFEYLSNVPVLPVGGLHKAFAPMTDYTHRLVSEAHAAGALRDFHIGDMGAFIGGGIRNTLKWRRAGGARLTDTERSEIVEMCWSAIAR